MGMRDEVEELEDFEEPEDIPEPEPIPQVFTVPESMREERRLGRPWVIALIAVLAIGGIVGGLIVARKQVVDLWPGANSVYALVGFGVSALGTASISAAPKPSGKRWTAPTWWWYAVASST